MILQKSFGAQETFLIIVNVKKQLLHFLEKVKRTFERTIYLVYTFCHIINVLTVTFEQFNESLLNKSLQLLEKSEW